MTAPSAATAGDESSQEFWSAQLAGGEQQGGAAGPGGAVTVVGASILDPWVLVLLSNGNAALLEADAATGEGAVHLCPGHAQVLRDF